MDKMTQEKYANKFGQTDMTSAVDNTTIPVQTTGYVATLPQGVCPHCGHCPHCGRGGFRPYYAPWNPWPIYPQIWW